MLSSITPPVAIASFAAAGIAGAPPMKTGWASMTVGSIIYFLPFFFVLNPAFVLQGDLQESLLLVVTAIAGIIFICAGLQGYLFGMGDTRACGRMEWPLRVALCIGGFVLAAPGGGVLAVSNLQMIGISILILGPTLGLVWLTSKGSRT
jgi:TRAP-type uncharacterized transport system fused permease subunit